VTKTYRQRVHLSARIMGAIMALGVILFATLLGAGYFVESTMELSAAFMAVCLIVVCATRPSRPRRKHQTARTRQTTASPRHP
jgi:Na+/melibiose symporter-like transporter